MGTYVPTARFFVKEEIKSKFRDTRPGRLNLILCDILGQSTTHKHINIPIQSAGVKVQTFEQFFEVPTKEIEAKLRMIITGFLNLDFLDKTLAFSTKEKLKNIRNLLQVHMMSLGGEANTSLKAISS